METKVIKIDWKKKATKQQSQILKNKTTPISSTEEFPLMGYYKDNLVDGITISKSAKWWSIIFLAKDLSFSFFKIKTRDSFPLFSQTK